MRLRKNIARVTTFALVGALAVTAFFAINNNNEEETSAIAGTWRNILNTAWANPEDARYKNYGAEPGSSESAPFLIQTAEEFSGIRAFEGGDDLAGKYLMLANDIDLSAHYWDPIELYGKGDPEEDIEENDYDDVFGEVDESEVVHIDGNSRKITGMQVVNSYDRVPIQMDWGDGMSAGATGLFSYIYKARVADFRLENPAMALSETSGVDMWGYNGPMYGEVQVVDAAGAVAGISHNSRIAGVHVTGINLNYTAEFGEFFDGGDNCYNIESLALIEGDYEEPTFDCPAYYSPAHILMGGAVGYSFGESVIHNTSVKKGAVSAKPVVDETLAWGMDFYDGGVAMGGLVGYNYQSAVLSTCGSADVVFSDDGYELDQREYVGLESVEESIEPFMVEAPSRELSNYGMFFGGLVGFSSTEYNIQACVYNSCAHSELNIDAEISDITAVGGLVGGVVADSMVNNYFDGTIITSEDNIRGEIVGYLGFDEDEGYMISGNYYVDRGVGPYGLLVWDDISEDAFTAITTVDKLVRDLNAGRETVVTDILNHSEYSEDFLRQRVTGWAVQGAAFPLACADGKAGLEFEDKRIVVPNTGVGV